VASEGPGGEGFSSSSERDGDFYLRKKKKKEDFREDKAIFQNGRMKTCLQKKNIILSGYGEKGCRDPLTILRIGAHLLLTVVSEGALFLEGEKEAAGCKETCRYLGSVCNERVHTIGKKRGTACTKKRTGRVLITTRTGAIVRGDSKENDHYVLEVDKKKGWLEKKGGVSVSTGRNAK